MPFPCHLQLPLHDLSCVSTSNRRHCPCFVVRFRHPLDSCLCGSLFLGKAVWRGNFCGGGGVVECWWWWQR